MDLSNKNKRLVLTILVISVLLGVGEIVWIYFYWEMLANIGRWQVGMLAAPFFVAGFALLALAYMKWFKAEENNTANVFLKIFYWIWCASFVVVFVFFYTSFILRVG